MSEKTKITEPAKRYRSSDERGNRTWMVLEAEYKAMAEQRDRLRAALEKYGAHQPNCDKWETVGDQLYFHGGINCTCGLDAALKSSRGDL